MNRTARPNGPTDEARSLPRRLALAVCLALAAAGCVQRRMMIRTNPPGALVYVDDYEIGTTPIATNFTYYGTRKIRLVKDGYETMTIMQDVPPPWYQIPPLDFFSENLVPGEIRDYHTFTYQLRPQAVVPTEQLLGRAESFRGEAQSVSASATTPHGPAPLPGGSAPYGPGFPDSGPAGPAPPGPGPAGPGPYGPGGSASPGPVSPPGGIQYQGPPAETVPTPSPTPAPGSNLQPLPEGTGGYPVHPLPGER